MNKGWTFSILLSVGLIACSGDPREILRTDLKQMLDSLPGTHAVAFWDLTTDDSLLIHPDLSFHAASTMKTPVMLEVFRQAAQGKFAMNDSLTITGTFRSIADTSTYTLSKSDDSDTLIYNHIGEKRTVHDLVYDMVTISSNLATNMLIEKVTAPAVERTLRELGISKMRVLRGVEDTPAFKAGLNNTTNARDQALLYARLARYTAADSASTHEMITILSDQKFNEKIPALLPEDVRVAHKTGSITAVHHDGGVVYLPDGRKYVVVILTAGFKDERAALQTMARTSKRIFDYVTRNDR